VRAERDARLEAQRTAERLSEHSDWIACNHLGVWRVVERVPGFEGLERYAVEAREQLGPVLTARCGGAE
jgi:hypothetical protein